MHPRSQEVAERIAELAFRLYCGETQQLKMLLEAMSIEVDLSQDKVVIGRNPHANGGMGFVAGLPLGLDPPNAVVQLVMLTLGPMGMMTEIGGEALKFVNKMWKRHLKGDEPLTSVIKRDQFRQDWHEFQRDVFRAQWREHCET